VNILEDPALRAGMKAFSSWPTFPQLYLGGAFVGGSDIMRAMHDSGELRDELVKVGVKVPPPEAAKQ
jgi:monothiol glutaredoxin